MVKEKIWQSRFVLAPVKELPLDLFAHGLIAEEVLCRCYETFEQRKEGVRKAPDHLYNSGKAMWGSSCAGVYSSIFPYTCLYIVICV